MYLFLTEHLTQSSDSDMLVWQKSKIFPFHTLLRKNLLYNLHMQLKCQCFKHLLVIWETVIYLLSMDSVCFQSWYVSKWWWLRFALLILDHFHRFKGKSFFSLPVSQQCVCDSKLWCHICIKWWHWMKSLFDCVLCSGRYLKSSPYCMLQTPKELELYRKYSHYRNWRLPCLLVIKLMKCKYVFVFHDWYCCSFWT